MAYASWSVIFGETPSASKWNILGTNDAEFNDAEQYVLATKAYAWNVSSMSAIAFTNLTTPATGIATFPEAFTMVVQCMGHHVNAAAATAALEYRVIDQASNEITQNGTAAHVVYSQPQNLWQSFSFMGKQQMASNTSAGMTVQFLYAGAGAVGQSEGYALVTFVRGSI